MTGVNRNSEASAARPELVVMMMMRRRRILMLMFMMVMMIAVMMMAGVNRNSAIKEQTWNLSKKIRPPDFQAKNFTPSISPNFNSFSGKKHKK